MRSKTEIALVIFALALVLSVNFVSAYDSGWINLRDKNDYVVCGDAYPACSSSKLGVDWYKQIWDNDIPYELICGEIAEVGRTDCLLMSSGAVGQSVSVPQSANYYVMLKAWYAYTSAGNNEKMRVGVSSAWGELSIYQNVADLGSGNKMCVLRNPISISSSKNKFWVQGVGESVHPYSYKVASCISQTDVDSGLVYCDDGASVVANCPIVCIPVNGGWSATSEGDWSVCSNGQKTRTLTQTCNNPTPNSCGSNCVTTQGWTRNGNVQTKIETATCTPVCIPTTEICDNNIDDDCDGEIDENCNPQCTTNSQCNSFNFNSSNYCYSNDVYKDSAIFSCISQTCQANPFQRILVQDCGEDSSVNSSLYCSGNNVVKNVTSVDRGCTSSSCFANSQNDVQAIETCINGCYNGVCLANNSGLNVVINYPTNGMIFNSNYSPYLINLNASANQVVNNWSVNGVGYSGGNYNLSRIVNISFGSNSFAVCGTNVNGTDCDSVVVTLVNSSVVINTTLFIDIISPIATTYDDGRILLNISSNGTNVWYNYNGTNITYNGILFLNLEEGDYNLMAWANNSTGAIVFDSVNFSVDFNNGDDDDEDCNGCNDCEPVEDGSIFIDNQNETVLVLGDSLPASGDNGQMGLGTLMLILLGGIILIMIVILVVVLARVLS